MPLHCWSVIVTNVHSIPLHRLTVDVPTFYHNKSGIVFTTQPTQTNRDKNIYRKVVSDFDLHCQKLCFWLSNFLENALKQKLLTIFRMPEMELLEVEIKISDHLTIDLFATLLLYSDFH